jgi:predicted homoserine dehydrogenase-like protein
MIFHAGLSTLSTTSIACSARLMKMESGVSQDNILETDASDPTMDGLNTCINIVISSYSLASQLEAIDIVFDVTLSPAVGAETAYICF